VAPRCYHYHDVLRPHLASLVDDFRRHGDQIAVVSRHGLRKELTTYKTLADLCGRFASHLESRSIVKGDRVLIWGENSAEWIGAFFGCILRGVLPVPIDLAGSESFAHRVAQEVDPKLVTGSRDQMKSFPNGLAFEDFASLPLTTAGAIDGICETNPVQIVFTSGTTGDPKGVVHTHANILASLRPIEQEMQKYLKYERIFHPLRFLHTLPLSHVFGQFMGIWIPALLAAEVHFESRLIPADLIQTIHDERISVLVAVPRVLEILQTHLNVNIDKAKGFSALHKWWHFRKIHRQFGLKFWALICGGATLPENLERFWNTLGFVVIQGYGMTETAALVSLNHPFHASQGSIGKVLPGREIRLGPDGEILVRGETVSKSTWQGGRMQTQESEWLATGDLATQDASGNLKFKGRKKEVIVTAAGLNIYPDDLEAALLHQPLIKAAAVVESDGEPVAALVLRHPGDAADAVRAANAELAGYQQIRRWMIWPDPDFPRTSSGKILRREVAAGTAPRVLTDILEKIKGKVPDSEDLQLDSLGRVELQAAIESQFGVEIDVSQANTLGQLRGLLSGVPKPETHDEHRYPTWPWSPVQNAIRVGFIELVVRPFVAVLGHPHVDHLEPLSKPVLIVANHVSLYDVPLILYALPAKMRHRVAVAMAGEMLLKFWKTRVVYFIVTGLFNVFPLPQLGNFRKSFQHAGRAMDRGFHVLVFPEGRRTPDGMMHPFQKGAGMLWKELQCEALPVYLDGMKFRSKTLSIRIGKPIPFNPNLDPAEATDILEAAVRSLSQD
jgi:long-chain acyl-CoA synthetase